MSDQGHIVKFQMLDPFPDVFPQPGHALTAAGESERPWNLKSRASVR